MLRITITNTNDQITHQINLAALIEAERKRFPSEDEATLAQLAITDAIRELDDYLRQRVSRPD